MRERRQERERQTVSYSYCARPQTNKKFSERKKTGKKEREKRGKERGRTIFVVLSQATQETRIKTFPGHPKPKHRVTKTAKTGPQKNEF